MLDIKVNGNMISGRQGWAYICNSQLYPVLNAEITESGDKEFRTFGAVRVSKRISGNRELVVAGRLEVENGNWSIGSSGTCLSASFNYNDMTELIENANAPVVKEGDVVAIAYNFTDMKFASLFLFKVGKIDTHCMTMANLIPLTEEEMEEIDRVARKWCDR